MRKEKKIMMILMRKEHIQNRKKMKKYHCKNLNYSNLLLEELLQPVRLKMKEMLPMRPMLLRKIRSSNSSKRILMKMKRKIVFRISLIRMSSKTILLILYLLDNLGKNSKDYSRKHNNKMMKMIS